MNTLNDFFCRRTRLVMLAFASASLAAATASQAQELPKNMSDDVLCSIHLSLWPANNAKRRVDACTRLIQKTKKSNAEELARLHFDRGRGYNSVASFSDLHEKEKVALRNRAIADFTLALVHSIGGSSEFRIQILTERARTHNFSDTFPAALDDIAAALRLAQDTNGKNQILAGLLLQKAQIHKSHAIHNTRVRTTNHDAAIAAFGASVADYLEVIKTYPDAITDDHKRSLAENYRRRARIFFAKQDMKSAIADYLEAIRFKNEALADVTKAKGPVRESRSLYSSETEYEELCDSRLREKSEPEQAAKDCSESIRVHKDINPTFGPNRALLLRGIAYLRLAKYDEAIADFDQWLKARSGSAVALYGRGIAKLQKGDLPGGRVDIAAALTEDADIATGLHSMFDIRPPG